MFDMTIILVKNHIILGGAFVSNNDNRKEEILARSRNIKKDEGMEHAISKGGKLGEYVMAVIALPILVFAALRGEIAVFLAIGATVGGFVTAQCFAEYRFTKRVYHLTWTVLMVMTTIICIGLFVAVSFGWLKLKLPWGLPL